MNIEQEIDKLKVKCNQKNEICDCIKSCKYCYINMTIKALERMRREEARQK